MLTAEGHENRTYSLTSDASVGFGQIAAYISGALGKEVTYRSPEVETFRAVLGRAGVPEMYIGMSIMWGRGLAEGMMDLEDNSLESLLGRKPASVGQFINRVYG